MTIKSPEFDSVARSWHIRHLLNPHSIYFHLYNHQKLVWHLFKLHHDCSLWTTFSETSSESR